MKERPIIFSSEMVRAILTGRKRQTRRVINPQPEYWPGFDFVDGDIYVQDMFGDSSPLINYGNFRKGGTLWVRETWALRTPSYPNHHAKVFYKDSQNKTVYHQDTIEPTQKYGYDLSEKDRWRPSIHMPRWASRITLKIVKIKVERLQDISEKDAKAEGVEPIPRKEHNPRELRLDIFRREFKFLWNSLHEKQHRWHDNPWVWVIEFEKS